MKNISPHKSFGFTLIELLVVVAIISILTAIVVASISSSRQRGIKTAVEANLAGARPQAELFHLSNQNYIGVCGAVAVGGARPILEFITAAAATAGVGAVATDAAVAQGANQAICWEQADGWIASVPIPSGQYFCVDGANAGRIVATAIPANTFVCP